MAQQHLIYHWKHGWIPLTHAAALSKAHGSAHLADKYVPGTSGHHGSLESVKGLSARDIHKNLEPHRTGHSGESDVARLNPGDVATVHGMDQYGRTTKFTGTVAGKPTPVRIKEGRTGTPVEHLAVQMHNGTPEGGGLDATARGVVYVKRAQPEDTQPSEARQFGAAANAGERANVQQAQAQARAEALRGVKPQQSELFGAHGEHQADLFEQPAAPRPKSTLRQLHEENQANLEAARAQDNAEVMRRGRAIRAQQGVATDSGKARKGDLAVLSETHHDYVIGQGRQESTSHRIVRVGKTTREGVITHYVNLGNDNGKPIEIRHNATVTRVPRGALDEAAVEKRHAGFYNDQFSSLEDAKAALQRHHLTNPVEPAPGVGMTMNEKRDARAADTVQEQIASDVGRIAQGNRSHEYTPEKGAAAAAALQVAHDQQQRRHIAAREPIAPSTGDLSEAAAQWKRENPGKKLAGHEREVGRLARDIAERKFVETGVRSQNTPEQSAAERGRVQQTMANDEAFKAATAQRLAAESRGTTPAQMSGEQIRQQALRENAHYPDAAAEISAGKPEIHVRVQSDGKTGRSVTAVVTPTIVTPDGSHVPLSNGQVHTLRRFDGRLTPEETANRASKRIGVHDAQVPVRYLHSGVLTDYHKSNQIVVPPKATGPETPEETAARIGMEFVKPTVKSHTLIGEGATVESATSTPAAPAASEARAHVEHSGDGTLLTIDRNDTEARSVAKSLGFRWSRNLGSWYLPRNQTESTRRQKIDQLQSRLGAENVHVEDAGRGATTTAAEREAETRARAADRAERMDARASRHTAEAERRFGTADQISSHIPMGQPILVGHHSEGRHRRDLARIDSNMRKGLEESSAAKAAEHSAENARRTAEGDNPLKRQRRIDRLEADVRSIDRELKDHELAGRLQATNPEKYAKVAHVVRRLDDNRVNQLQTRRAELADQIEHDKSQIAAAGFQAPSASHVEPGDLVHYRGRAHVVSKVNQKTVSVPTGYSWEDKVPLNQVTKVTKLADLSESALRSALQLAGNNPKLRERYMRELERRGLSATA